MNLGLRVDVDTYRGTRLGVPALSRLLADGGQRATFYFSMGPDNMGRHLWRLLHPTFLWKMLRSNAPGLYGWDILWRGTLWPGPEIGKHLAPVIQATARAGHEVGMHAWDHHAWQTHLDGWSDEQVRAELRRGLTALERILGHAPTTTAAPAWKCDQRTLRVKESFNLAFNSDCRGRSLFVPEVTGGHARPQVPVTLPTHDEMVGRGGMTPGGYYRHVESLLDPEGLNVLAIHAEVEGISMLAEFGDFLQRIGASDGVGGGGWRCVALGDLIPEDKALPPGYMEKATVPGREGWLARQVGGGIG